MLILKRGLGQRILIGDDIVVTITEIGNNSVKVGVDAPTDVPIFREELCNGSGSTRRDLVPPDARRR